MSKQVTIKLDSAAYEYSSKKWMEIAGIEPMDVTLRMTNGVGIPNVTVAAIIGKIDELIKKVDDFIPMTLTDKNDGMVYKMKNDQWIKHLKSIKKELRKAPRPVYLTEAVNKILKDSKVTMRCTNLILTKCLHMLGEENLTPERIASTMIEYSRTPWDKIPVPKNITKKSFRIQQKKDKGDNKSAPVENDKGDENKSRKKKTPTQIEVVEALFLFPYSCPLILKDGNILNKIQHDLNLLEGYSKWLQESMEYKLTPDYRSKYESFRDELLTVPPAEDQSERGSSAYEMALCKFRNGDQLNENDQLALLQERMCPLCGKEIKEANGPKGLYLNCSNHYFAGLRDGNPYVNDKYKSGVRPVPAT